MMTRAMGTLAALAALAVGGILPAAVAERTPPVLRAEGDLPPKEGNGLVWQVPGAPIRIRFVHRPSHSFDVVFERQAGERWSQYL